VRMVPVGSAFLTQMWRKGVVLVMVLQQARALFCTNMRSCDADEVQHSIR